MCIPVDLLSTSGNSKKLAGAHTHTQRNKHKRKSIFIHQDVHHRMMCDEKHSNVQQQNN